MTKNINANAVGLPAMIYSLKANIGMVPQMNLLRHAVNVTVVQVPKGCQISSVEPSHPAVVIENGNAYLIDPITGNVKKGSDQNGTFMMGGTFIFSYDSRFQELFGRNPVPLHDRFEPFTVCVAVPKDLRKA